MINLVLSLSLRAMRVLSGGAAPPETFYILDESSNILTDEAGNRLTWS